MFKEEKSESKPEKGSSRQWELLNPPLSQWMREALNNLGFTQMTPVQASTIPLFMGHKDVVVEVRFYHQYPRIYESVLLTDLIGCYRKWQDIIFLDSYG